MGWLKNKENQNSVASRACRFTYSLEHKLLATSFAKNTGPENKPVLKQERFHHNISVCFNSLESSASNVRISAL